MADQSTASWALFRQSAEDLAAKLAESQQADAQRMAREARELVTVFAAWNTVRPTNEARIAAIHQLFDLNRRAMDFLSNQGRPATTRSSRPPTSSAASSSKPLPAGPPSSRRPR